MRRAVVLDRDGVINDNHEKIHVNRPQDLILFDGAAKAIRLLKEAGFMVMVATNQGGVGLGYLSQDQLDAIHARMVSELATQGAVLDDIAACIHAPHAGCACRKPKPGMLLTLQERHGFEAANSYMVGDMKTDVEAGKAAGMRTVFIGQSPMEADCVAPDILAAARWIVAQG
ncbi:MAG: HAD family hydrolase [Alicyclobacillus sp.]|nr:HAD family hydrolase [Alicyclobacillus sp.]